MGLTTISSLCSSFNQYCMKPEGNVHCLPPTESKMTSEMNSYIVNETPSLPPTHPCYSLNMKFLFNIETPPLKKTKFYNMEK